jgi:hypothetical protein
MISSIRSWCKPAWLSHQTSRRLILKRELAERSLTSLISCFRLQDHAPGSSSLHVRYPTRRSRLAPYAASTSMNFSTPPCHQGRSRLLMWWPCTCIVARLRRYSRMKTRNKHRTAGALIPPGARSSGSFSPNGPGTCAWNWATRYTQPPCAPPNSRPLEAPDRWQNRAVPFRQQPFPTNRPCGQPPAWDVSRANTSRPSQTAPSSALLVSPYIPRSVAPNEMAVYAWCMLPASVIVVPVRGVKSARAMEQPPRNRVASAQCSGRATKPRRSLLSHLHFPLLILLSGETGSGVFIGENW